MAPVELLAVGVASSAAKHGAGLGSEVVMIEEPRLTDIMARSNIIWCSRCANEDTDDPSPFARSWVRFQARGWTYGNGRVFCPQCSADLVDPDLKLGAQA